MMVHVFRLTGLRTAASVLLSAIIVFGFFAVSVFAAEWRSD